MSSIPLTAAQQFCSGRKGHHLSEEIFHTASVAPGIIGWGVLERQFLPPAQKEKQSRLASLRTRFGVTYGRSRE